MQAPTLFIIAADLTKMQVNANIDEADVGRIRPGQHVTFRVDAYPAEAFDGTVAQVRLQPVVVQNVTTYGTVIDVPNPQLKLKPGMTATVKVEISHKTNVLRVPNGSIRFRPTIDVFAALNQPVPPEAQVGAGRGRASASTGPSPAGSPAATLSPRPAAPAPDASNSAGEGDRQAERLARFHAMPPDRQQAFIERMKGRGQDVSAFQTAPAPGRAESKKPRGEFPRARRADHRRPLRAPASG